MQNISQSCRRFHALLANPTSPDTWGTLEFTDPKPEFVWALCLWMQPRLKGDFRLGWSTAQCCSMQSRCMQAYM